MNEIIEAIKANGIQRNFSILGGEPLCTENLALTKLVVGEVRKHYPEIKIFLWSGYLYEDLIKNKEIKQLLKNIDYLIDGPYVHKLRDITLHLRGSTNQRIINLTDM